MPKEKVIRFYSYIIVLYSLNLNQINKSDNNLNVFVTVILN